MASVLAQRVPDDMAGDNRDVADLWKDALKTYKGIVGFDLERKFENVEAMITQGTKEMQNFHKFRHDDKKVDKLRGLFSANLDYIEKGAQQLVAAAVPAFPPAAAIGTAVTFMLSEVQACRKVSADYDIVMVFFEDMNSFLQRIVILETRLPKYNAYQNCLMEVFTSFLTMCGFAHKYIELGRFKKWISSLIQGEDSELGGARKKMDLRIRRLQEATEFAILGNTEEIQKMTSELQKNQHSHTAMLAEQMQVMSVVRDTTESIRDDMAKLLRAFDDQKREQNKQRGGGDQKGKPSAAEHGKHPSAKGIRNTLMEVEGEDHEYHVLQETIVPDTCAWAFREPEWERWLHQQDPPNTVLAITGSPGMGKSHLAFSVYQALKSEEVAKDSSRRTCVAQFYFREQDESLSSFTNGVISVINQVAEQSPELCEAMYAEIVRDESQIDRGSSDDLLRKLLGVAFGTDSKGRLFLVFDGIDEIADKDLALFEQFGKTIEEGALRISMVYTARSGISVQESSSNPPLKVHITREKQMDDLRTIIWARINSLGALRRFSRYVQQRIADKTEEIAPNILYAEHLLARLNTLEREGAVLRSLEKPLPPTLYQLYEVTTAECFRRTESSRRALVSKLLQWTAYSLRPINLNEGLSLLRFWSNDDDFDLEEIPEPFAKLLRIGDPDSGAETRAKIQSRGGWGTAIDELEKAQKASQPDDLYQDGNLPIKFRERSMRGFFREEPVEPNEGHRPRRSEAHRQMFLACFNFIQPAHHNTVNVDKGLREYAVNYVLHHWRDIEEKHLNVEQQAEVMETFASLMLDKSSFAKIQEEELRIEYAIYDDEKFDDSFFDRLRSWAGLLCDAKLSLNMEAAEWWALIADRPRDCLVQLAKSHVRRLQYAVDIKTAEVSFLAAKDALRICDKEMMLKDQAGENFASAVGDVSGALSIEQAVLGFDGLFGDIDLGSNGYHWLAALQFLYKQVRPAEDTCLKAMSYLQTPLERVQSLELLSRIRVKANPQAAYEDIQACMQQAHDDSVPLPLRRSVYTTKAQIETKLGRRQDAAASYELARSMDPSNLVTGDALRAQIKLFENEPGKQEFIRTLKTWSPLERLAYLCWDTWNSVYQAVIRAAVESGEVAFVVQMYQDSIRLLENVNASAPLLVELGFLHINATRDLEAARAVFDQALDSGSTGWPYAVTGEAPEATLDTANTFQSEVLYRLFRESADVKRKRELLGAVEGLLMRPLALDVPPISNTALLYRQIVLARMYLKLGPAEKFHETLQGVVDSCVGALSDNVGWNDRDNLVCLAMSLGILGGIVKDGQRLKRAAQILLSAQMSRLDPNVKDENRGDGEEREEEHSDDDSDNEDSAARSKGDEGDLDDDTVLFCDGGCMPTAKFASWAGRVSYLCLVCSECFLCEDCYKMRGQDDHHSSSRPRYMPQCPLDHEYIEAPVKGWKGVVDGRIMLEDEEPVAFRDYLQVIPEELCKEAWESFWRQ